MRAEGRHDILCRRPLIHDNKGKPGMDLPPPPVGGARLYALGDLRIFDARDRSVASLEAQPKRAALLIYLACMAPGTFCPRDQLLALFWPDFDDERARNSLRSSLYYVRRAIGPGLVHSRSDGALETDANGLWCDVRAFDAAVAAGRWAEAAELYRGDFLQGSALSVSVEFDHWVEATRRRLRRQCADALFRVAELHEQQSDMETALEVLARARALLPADEAILRRVLLLWGRLGNRVGAVQEYEAFSRTLEHLYELQPSQETREILDRVTGGSLQPPPPPPRMASATPDGEGATENGGEVGSDDAGPAGATAAVRLPSRAGPPSSPAMMEHRRRVRWGGATVAAALVVTASAIGWAKAVATPPAEAEVAVLPFHLSGSSDLAPLTEALPALLSDELRHGGWRVLESRSLADAAPRWDDQVNLARGLGATTVVTGQVIAMSDSVAILVATVPTDGHPVPREWARVTGRPEDLGAMAAKLARDLAGKAR